MKNVLCVCFGNTCRSPMMEKLLQRILGNEYRVESAGVRDGCDGQPANEHSITCTKDLRLDLTNHVSRSLASLNLGFFDYVVCVGEGEAAKVREKTCHLQTPPVILVANEKAGGIPNPYEKGLDAYRACLATLIRTLPEVADIIRR